MGAGKPRAGGARRVVVGIPFSEAAAIEQNPVADAERQLEAAERVPYRVWPKPAENALVPVAARGQTIRRSRGPAMAWAIALATVAAFNAILLGWVALRDDPSASPSILHSQPAGPASEPNNAMATVPGRAPMTAGHWRTAEPADQTRALAYAVGTPNRPQPELPDESHPITGKPSGAVRSASRELSEKGANAASPAIGLITAGQGAQQLDPSALIARGDAFLRQSDAVSARLFYRLAVANGSAAGAIAMGSTYDSAFLADNAVRGVKPEPEQALVWYRTAVQLGAPDGKTRTAQLLDALRLDAARGDAHARAILDKAATE